MKNFRLLLLLTLLIAPVAFAQNKVTVKGVVKSAETGEPLFGAYILVGGGGASTDENGAYSVTAAPGETLSYQYIGCVVSEFIVPSGQATVVHDVELKADNSLDDVVVVAYGVRKKGTIAGSVATVKSEALADVLGRKFRPGSSGESYRFDGALQLGRTKRHCIIPDSRHQLHQCGDGAAVHSGRPSDFRKRFQCHQSQ